VQTAANAHGEAHRSTIWRAWSARARPQRSPVVCARPLPCANSSARRLASNPSCTSCEAITCAGVGSSQVLRSASQKRLPVEEGSVTMRVIRFLVTTVAAVVLLSAPAYGATWTTQTTSRPTALAESALTSVSCVSALSFILENCTSSR
jgi:hypothetical protein